MQDPFRISGGMMGNNKPLVSIVIPIFNAALFVSEMLDDLFSQTFRDWELFLIDDGSTDNSKAICEKYMAMDNRIHFFERPCTVEKGGNSCRNYGMKLAKGQYIIWFDADDRIAPYCLEQRVYFMEKNDFVDIGVFPAVNLKETQQSIVDFALGFDVPTDPIRFFIQGSLWFAVWTNIYRLNSLLENNIRWSEGLASRQDCDFNLSCMRAGLTYRLGKGKEDYYYRILFNSNSISKGINKGKSRATLDFFSLQYNKFKDVKGIPLRSLVHYVFECVMVQDDMNVIRDFLDADYFNNNVFDRYKFRFLISVESKMPTRIHSVFKLLLFPISFLRYRKNKIRTNIIRDEWAKYASVGSGFNTILTKR